jgi:hypothetical protein
MTVQVTLLYRSAGHLARHLRDHLADTSLLVPLRDGLDLHQFQLLTLRFVLPGGDASFPAEVLQLIPSLGVAVRLVNAPAELLALAKGASPDAASNGPLVTVSMDEVAATATPEDAEDATADVSADTEVADDAEPDAASAESSREGQTTEATPDEAEELAQLLAEDQPAPRARPTLGPLSWPLEKLQAEWHMLTLGDKARLAKYGKRHARGLVLRSQDRTLQQFLISNAHITPEEVAALAAMVNIDLAVLKRLASSPDWLRHTPIVRNLVCHPKATLPQITRLVDYLADDELRRLTRTGKVRASVKQLIARKLEQRAGRARRR